MSRKFTRRQTGARQAMATRAARAGALITRACSNCRHQVIRSKQHNLYGGEIYEIQTPMCSLGVRQGPVHTHIMRAGAAPCGPAGLLFEAKDNKGETSSSI